MRDLLVGRDQACAGVYRDVNDERVKGFGIRGQRYDLEAVLHALEQDRPARQRAKARCTNFEHILPGFERPAEEMRHASSDFHERDGRRQGQARALERHDSVRQGVARGEIRQVHLQRCIDEDIPATGRDGSVTSDTRRAVNEATIEQIAVVRKRAVVG